MYAILIGCCGSWDGPTYRLLTVLSKKQREVDEANKHVENEEETRRHLEETLKKSRDEIDRLFLENQDMRS